MMVPSSWSPFALHPSARPMATQASARLARRAALRKVSARKNIGRDSNQTGRAQAPGFEILHVDTGGVAKEVTGAVEVVVAADADENVASRGEREFREQKRAQHRN